MTGEDVLQVGRTGCSARIALTCGVELDRLEAAGRLAQRLGLAGTMSKPFPPVNLRALLA